MEKEKCKIKKINFKINLYNYKKILIPINIKNSHWSLVVLNINKRKFKYYDSLSNENTGYSIMTNLSELFSEYINHNNSKEDDYPCNLLNKVKVEKDKNEEDVTNKLSTSFSSHVNNDNLLNNTTNNINCINNVNIINSHTDSSQSSGSDLHMMTSFWKFKIADTPTQYNYADCGVFLCKFMDYISREESLTFDQEDITYFRILIGAELLKGEMLI